MVRGSGILAVVALLLVPIAGLPAAASSSSSILTFTEADLGGSGTGWFLAEISSDTDTTVEVRAGMRAASDDELTAQVLAVAGAARAVPAVVPIVSTGSSQAKVSAAGARIGCCDAVSGRGFTSVTIQDRVTPATPLYVAFGVVGWNGDATATITVTAAAGSLTLVAVSTGTDVRAIDLVDESKRDGVHAALPGRAETGVFGDVGKTWQVPTGLVGASYDFPAGASGHLEVRLPDGSGIIRNVAGGNYGSLYGAVDAGLLRLTLEDASRTVGQSPARFAANVVFLDAVMPGHTGVRLSAG